MEACHISAIPVQVAGLTGGTVVAAGTQHVLALKRDGTVWAWGKNTMGSLGYTAPGWYATLPQQVDNLTGVVAVAAGDVHSVALTAAGTMWVWGDHGAGG